MSPERGRMTPPGPPLEVGGDPPPSTPPAVHIYQAYELIAKVHGAGVMLSKRWWGSSCCGDATMGYIKTQCKSTGLYTMYKVSLKKNGNLAKVTMWRKTMGSVYYIM